MNYIDYTITKLVERLEELAHDLSQRGDCLNENHIARLSDFRDDITTLIEPPEPDCDREPHRRCWHDMGA